MAAVDPHVDPDIRAVMDAIRRIVRGLRETSRAAEKRHGVSGAQLFVLQRLAHDGPSSIAGLAARTATDPSSVSVVVQRLVERRLVTRVAGATDRRRREIALTAGGRALARRRPGAAQDRLLAALARMPAPQRRRLARLLGGVVAGMGEARTPATMFFEDSGRSK